MHAIDGICFPGDIAFSRSELGRCLNQPGSIARLAEGSGRILGFVVAQIESGDRAHIVTLDVIPEARRQGIGTALMNAMHEELGKRGVRVSFLEVGVHNIAARRLYEGLRYRDLGILRGYYRGREDACSMGRTIVPASPMGNSQPQAKDQDSWAI